LSAALSKDRRDPHRKQRLFIALWPSAQARRPLAKLTRQHYTDLGGRQINEQKQHVTLIFLGDVDAGRVAQVKAIMQRAAADTPAFELQLDVVEYRRNGGMLWARATQTPDRLAALVLALRAALRASGFAVEDRAFVPHLTLLRDARKPARKSAHIDAMALLRWQVHEISLVRSRLSSAGASYEVLNRAPLSAGAARGG
jgi:RNA 2',3'-cyclic 3'-phosphodiesterase